MPCFAQSLLLLCILTLLTGSALAQVCGTSTQMRFKPATDALGTPSYINRPNAPVSFIQSTAMPTIIIQTLALDATNASLGYDFSLDGTTIAATTIPALRMGGNSVQVNRGEALFTALTIQETPSASTSVVIVFSLVAPNGKTLTLTTGVLNAVPTSSQNSPASVRFANKGFFTREGQNREVALGVTIPTFSLEILNSAGNVVAASAAVNVVANGATVSPTTLNSFTVTNLVVSGATTNFSLTFTVFSGTWSGSTFTGDLTPVTISQRSRFMQFSTDASASFITLENQGGTAVLGIPMPPIVINLLTSQLALDATNTGLIITASCSQGDLSGAQAVVKQGVAIFSNLAFVGVAPTSAVIIFTAGSQGNVAVQGATLSSGAIAVTLTAVKAYHLSFAPSSSLSSTATASFAPSGNAFTIPQIIVQVKDSAYQLDSTANSITLSISGSGVIAVDSTALKQTVSNGIAVWNNLQYTFSATSFQLTISDSQRSVSANVQLQSDEIAQALSSEKYSTAMKLLTDCIPSSSTAGCKFSLRFASSFGAFSSSIFSDTSQQTFATVGEVIPTVVVECVNALGVCTSMPTSAAPGLIAYTGSDPDGETLLVTTNQANYGQWQNGRYYFSCLQFVKVPKNPVRIKFMPINSNTVPAVRYLGMLGSSPLQSLFFSVVPSRTLAYGIRFSSSETSFFLYEGQMSSVVVNVALPQVVIEMVDSLGDFDSSDSSTFIVASTSSGTLADDGTRVAVSGGRATFSNLLFLSISDSPILTFTVHGRAGSTVPAIGQSVSTGYLTATSLPLSEFEIDVMPSLNGNNIVTRQFQQIVFANVSDATVKVSIIVRNSAHEAASSISDTILISPRSDQATLDNIQSAKIDSSVACACVNFTNKITGYQSGYQPGTPIYITYTVITGTGLLLGKSVVVGPIAVNELDQASTSCAANLVSPAVVGEFRMTVPAFMQSTVRTDLAALLGISGDRVNIPTASIVGITRVDFNDLTKTWSGTKATIFFLDPPLNSVNPRSGSELAAAFVALRPGCDATNVRLEAAYYQSDATLCDATKFQASKTSTESCVASGVLPLCQCYAQGVVAEWGIACTEDATVSKQLSTICGLLTECAEAGILTLCDIVATDSGSSLTWLWATMGSIAGLALVAVLLRRSGFVVGRSKATLTNNRVED